MTPHSACQVAIRRGLPAVPWRDRHPACPERSAVSAPRSNSRGRGEADAVGFRRPKDPSSLTRFFPWLSSRTRSRLLRTAVRDLLFCVRQPRFAQGLHVILRPTPLLLVGRRIPPRDPKRLARRFPGGIAILRPTPRTGPCKNMDPAANVHPSAGFNSQIEYVAKNLCVKPEATEGSVEYWLLIYPASHKGSMHRKAPIVGTSISSETAMTAISHEILSQNIPHFREDPQNTPTSPPRDRNESTSPPRDMMSTYLSTKLGGLIEAKPKKEQCR